MLGPGRGVGHQVPGPAGAGGAAGAQQAYRRRVNMRAQEPAALSMRAHLRHGRVLRGWPLTVAVGLCELPC